MNSSASDTANLLEQPLILSKASAPAHAMRVVAIGGGTGLSTLLRGLREHVTPTGLYAKPRIISDLAAVVTVTDDGGSSGRLRQGFNMLPPGDLRNCMLALSEEEDLLAQLFAHRFRGGDALKGHNFGNLFVAALTEITGDFAHAIQLASKILAARGRSRNVPKPVILTASPPFTAEEIAYSIESKAFSASRLDSSDTSLILPMSSVLFTVTSLVIAEKSLQIQEQFPAEIKHPRQRR